MSKEEPSLPNRKATVDACCFVPRFEEKWLRKFEQIFKWKLWAQSPT